MVKILKLAGVVVVVLIAIAGAGLFRVTEAAKSPAYCASCHAMDTFVASTTNPTRLAAVHTQAGVTCQECHPQSTGQLVSEIVSNVSFKDSTPLDPIKFDTQACLNCHGTYAQLAARTQNLERNPHDSHQGQLDCRNCHQVHADSIYYCGQCHGADTMPKVGWVMPAGAQP
jgi:cytochrome c nitrite reductase small subunit